VRFASRLSSAAFRTLGLLAFLTVAMLLVGTRGYAPDERSPSSRVASIVIRFAVKQSLQDVSQVSTHVQVVAMGTAGKCQESRDAFSARDASCKKPIVLRLC
jgi:hypothetical protein